MPNLIDENANGKNRIKITKRSVESLEPLETGALIQYDEKLAGFGVRVMPSGRRFTMKQLGVTSADQGSGA